MDVRARYSIPAIAEGAGIPLPRLNTWLARGLLTLTGDGDRPKWKHRHGTFDDITAAALLAAVIDAGGDAAEASEAVSIFRSRGARGWLFVSGQDAEGRPFRRAVRKEDLARVLAPSGTAGPRSAIVIDVERIETEVAVRVGAALQAESWRRAQALGLMEGRDG